MFVVTTHQSSLKSYALNRPEILNASMEFDAEHLKPTYRFQSGIPGNSYAFVLAESIGMPQSVIYHAKTYLGDKHSELEQSIASLQIFKSQAEESLRIAHSERLAIAILKKDYEEKALEFKQKKSEYLQNAKQEAKEIVQKANALIEHTIKEIREQKRDITEIRKEFSAIKKEIEHSVKDNKDIIPADTGFVVGDAVMISDNQRDIGSIIIVDESSQSAIVEFNGIKFKTALHNLVKAKKSDQKKYQKSSSGILKLDAKTTIDIRGYRADEACKEVEKLISDALISNIAIVTIIHGKGTGALRQAIHSQLSQHPGVSSYRNGFIAEGGDGITVVEIA
jgi:DNA mismatch repair protein MutS2